MHSFFRISDRLSKAWSSIGPWFQSIIYALRNAVKIDAANVTAMRAIQGAVGIFIPLTLGVISGHTQVGVSIAGGAAMLGGVSMSDTHHTRSRTMLLACMGIAFSAFMGSITSRVVVLSILVAGLWGFGAGMLVGLGSTYLVIGLQSMVALIILTHFQLDPLHALLQASLMLGGALFQTLLSLIPIPSKRTSNERLALAHVYDALADYAVDAPNDQRGLQVSNELLAAYNTISGSNLKSKQGAILCGLLETAERLRLNILFFRHWRRRLLADADTHNASVEALDRFMSAVAVQLYAVADELRESQRLFKYHRLHHPVKNTLDDLRKTAELFEGVEEVKPLLKYSEILRRYLHEARKLTRSLRFGSRQLRRWISIPESNLFQANSAWTIIRANLNMHSAVFRHALRMGVVLALATALYQVTPLPFHNGYWIPLTAALVLRPDFSTTFTRGFARLLGTILGAALTTLLLSLITPTPTLLIALNVLSIYIAYSVLLVSYALFSLFLTIEVVCLLTFVSPFPVETALYRATDTVLGGVLALVIYVLWPTWERLQAPGYLAERVDAVRQYCTAVLDAYKDPKAYDHLKLEHLHTKARLARSNAEASVQRSLHEPRPHRINIDVAQGILGACDNIMSSALSLEAYLQSNPALSAIPEVTKMSNSMSAALSLLETLIRAGQRSAIFPDLQHALHELQHELKMTLSISTQAGEHSQSNPKDALKADQRFLVSELKRMIDNIEVLYHLFTSKSAPATGNLVLA